MTRILPRLLEVAWRPPCGAAAPSSGCPGAAPSSRSAARSVRRNARAARRKTSPSETWVASGTARTTRVIASSTAPGRADPRPEHVGQRPPDDASGLHLLAVQPAPAEREREEHRDGEDEQHQPGGLGSPDSAAGAPRTSASRARRAGRPPPRPPGRTGRRGPRPATPRSRRSSCWGCRPLRPAVQEKMLGSCGSYEKSARTASAPASSRRMPIASLARRLLQNGASTQSSAIIGAKAAKRGRSLDPSRSPPLLRRRPRRRGVRLEAVLVAVEVLVRRQVHRLQEVLLRLARRLRLRAASRTSAMYCRRPSGRRGP